jgi:hypothetical protein
MITLVLGIKEIPEPLNHKQQVKFLSGLGIDTSNLCTMKSGYFNLFYQGQYALSNSDTNSLQLPQFRFYGKNGEIIQGWQQCFGNIERIGLLDSFPMVPKIKVGYSYNQELNLFADTMLFRTNSGKSLVIDTANFDYFLVVYWSKSLGVFNKNFLKQINLYYKKHHKEHKIYLIKVNADNMPI